MLDGLEHAQCSSLRPKGLGKIMFPSAFPIPKWYSLSSFSSDSDSFLWYMAEAHRQDRSVGYVKDMPSRLCSGLQKQAFKCSSLNQSQRISCVKMAAPWLGVFLCFTEEVVSWCLSVSESQFKKLPYLCTLLDFMMYIGSLLTTGHLWVPGCTNHVGL